MVSLPPVAQIPLLEGFQKLCSTPATVGSLTCPSNHYYVPCSISHGGEPAPWSVTSGAVSDTSMITRNVERADHLDDPKERKIYEAEVVKVGEEEGKTGGCGMGIFCL